MTLTPILRRRISLLVIAKDNEGTRKVPLSLCPLPIMLNMYANIGTAKTFLEFILLEA